MKIVHILGWYFPESLGGTEVYVNGLCQRLQQAGHETLISAPKAGLQGERRYQHEGIPVYRYSIPAEPTRDEAQSRAPVRGTEPFHEWLRQQRADVYHFHTFLTGLGLPELRAAKETGAAVIGTTHYPSLGYICQRGDMLRWGERMCDGVCQVMKCAACDLHHRGLTKTAAWAVAAIPPAIGNRLNRLPGKIGGMLGMGALVDHNRRTQQQMLETVDRFVVLTSWARDAVIANGADPNKVVLNRLGHSHDGLTVKPSPQQQPTTRPIRVGFFGRFHVTKGVHDLARAVTSLPRDVAISVEFRGPSQGDANAQLVNELRQIVGDDPRVTFEDPVPSDQAPGVLAEYDVLACPSLWLEGGPTCAIEAQALGTPVIGTPMGGLAELVEDGVNGRLHAPRDWRGLAGILRDMAERPHATIDVWRGKLPKARTMDEICHDYVGLYRSVIAANEEQLAAA